MTDQRPSIYDIRAPFLNHLVERLWESLVGQVIQQVKDLPDNCRQSGEDSGLSSVWEEFKDQVQGQESIYYYAYVETIQSFCHYAIQGLTKEQRALLWLWWDGFIEWEEEGDQIPFGDPVDEAVEQELYGRICGVASDEELMADSDQVEIDEGDELQNPSDEYLTNKVSPPVTNEEGSEPIESTHDINDPNIEITPITAPAKAPVCFCFNENAELAWEARKYAIHTVTLEDRSHFMIDLFCCGKCSQYFLDIWTELIDWEGGDDSQGSFYIPITAQEAASLRGGSAALTEWLESNKGTSRTILAHMRPRGATPYTRWIMEPPFILPHD